MNPGTVDSVHAIVRPSATLDMLKWCGFEHSRLEKSSIVQVDTRALESLPEMVMVDGVAVADEIVGKFWSRFAPESKSRRSFGVTPSPSSALLRSIPRPPFEWMELRETRLPCGAGPLAIESGTLVDAIPGFGGGLYVVDGDERVRTDAIPSTDG